MYQYDVTIIDEQAFRELEYWYAELAATKWMLRDYESRIVDSETELFYKSMVEQKDAQECIYRNHLQDLLHIELTSDIIISYLPEYFAQRKIYVVAPYAIPSLAEFAKN